MSKKIILEVSKKDDLVGYLFLPKHPKKLIYGLIKKSIPINTLIKDYKGIPLYLDFDESGELIGIEIVG